MSKQPTQFVAAMAAADKGRPSGMKVILQRQQEEAREKDHNNYILLKEGIRNMEWKNRREKLGSLFPETIAERERRLNGGKAPVAPAPIEDKFVDFDPMVDFAATVHKVVKQQVQEKVVDKLWKKKYVTRKDRIAENVRNEFKRREEERYHEQELAKIENSKKQQEMGKLAAHYLSHPKMPGHHAHAMNITDYKNHDDADMELRRQRQKYHQMGHTHVPQNKAVPKFEKKKTWKEVILDGVANRDGYIPGRHSLYFGSQKIYALHSHSATFAPFAEFSTDAHDVCPEDRMHEVTKKIEWDEAVRDKTGEKMRALKSNRDKAALEHVDKVQKKSLYTRLKKNILDMSRRLIKYNKHSGAGEEELAGKSQHSSNHNNRLYNASMAESYVTSDSCEGSLKIIDSMLDTDGGSVPTVVGKGTEMDMLLDPKFTEQMKVAKARKKHLLDSDLKREVVKHMSAKSAVTPAIMQPYYDDHKLDSPLKPSLSQPVNMDSHNDVADTGRHLVSSRPQGSTYSPWVTTTYNARNPPQRPRSPELTEMLVQGIMSTPDIVNANTGPEIGPTGSMVEVRRARRLGFETPTNSQHPSPTLLKNHGDFQSQNRLGNALENSVIDSKVYGNVVGKVIVEDCSYADSREAGDVVGCENAQFAQLDDTLNGALNVSEVNERPSTVSASAHMRYGPVHERPKQRETHIYHQAHNYFPQRSVALSMIRRHPQPVSMNDVDLQRVQDQEREAAAMESPPAMRYTDKGDKKAYIAYHKKRDSSRQQSTPYLPGNSMSTDYGGLDGQHTSSGIFHPVHDEKFTRRDHHSNGVTMTPAEFKHYTIANTVRELYYRKKGVKIAPIQAPPDEVSQGINQDSTDANGTLGATRSQYLLENSREMQGKVKVPLVRMRGFNGIGNMHVRASTALSEKSKHRRPRNPEDKFDFAADVNVPSKYKFHFVSMKKLKFLKKKKKL